MRKSAILVLGVVMAAFAAGWWLSSGDAAFAADAAKPAPVLRHVVLFKFKDDAAPDQIQAVEKAFCALKDKISTVHSLEWGTDVSKEGLAQGFTHCFMLTFLSEADRDAYLPHPEHKAFGASLGPVLDKVVVVDYWTQP